MVNKKHDVGDPWRTPIVAEIMTQPRILLVTQYIAMIAYSMAAPQPSLYRILKSDPLGTLSYALENQQTQQITFCVF